MTFKVNRRIPIVALGLFLCLALLACQNYSSGLQQSMVRADETSATSALRTIAGAQRTYAASNDGQFATFQQLSEGGYLDERFNSSQPTIKDYVLKMDVTPKAQGQVEGFYSCKADPITTGGKVGAHFYIDSTSSGLHVNPNESATARDPIAQP